MPSFGSQARLQQARFRASSATISGSARHPTDAKGRKHAHLLAVGFANENLIPSLRDVGGAEDFFRTRGIQWWRSPLSGDAPRGDGPTRNLTSSQVSCVNFLLPLNQSPSRLGSILGSLDSDVMSIAPVTYIGPDGTNLSSNVEFEWIGLGGPLERDAQGTRGANVTSADALILADLRPRGRRAYLFEWKYSEEYPANKYLGDGEKGETRLRRYSGRYDSPASPFETSVPFRSWLYDPFYQIMRILLLGQKMVEERQGGVTEAAVVVVCPAENAPYRDRITSPWLAKLFPEARTVAAVVRRGLKRPREFRMVTQDDLLKAVIAGHPGGLTDWIVYHRERYGWAGQTGQTLVGQG